MQRVDRTTPSSSLPWLCGILLAGLSFGAATSVRGQGFSAEEVAQLRALPLPTNPSARLAIVGDEYILVGDLLPKVDAQIKRSVKVDLSQVPPDELKIVRLKLLRGLLVQTIQTKMLGQAFLLDKVGAASLKQREEARAQMDLQTAKMFWRGHVGRLKEKFEVDTNEELEALLAKEGTSLAQLAAESKDQMLKQAYLQEMLPEEPKISLQEIVRYYNQHIDEYYSEATARWEQLTVRFDRFPSREAAAREIQDMFREARFGGNVQSVAKARSQGPLAPLGGLHDWTAQGTLRSKPLDHKIFTVPLNRLSEIIEDEVGLHVIRVLERRPAGVRPLSEVQDEIREVIREQKLAAAEKRLLAEIRQQVPVWSRYPEDMPGAMPLPEATAKRRR
jgi:parvulin-like peptidyl-prolyl isomerase